MPGATRGGFFSATYDGTQAREACTRGAGKRDMPFLRSAPGMPELRDIDP